MNAERWNTEEKRAKASGGESKAVGRVTVNVVEAVNTIPSRHGGRITRGWAGSRERVACAANR